MPQIYDLDHFYGDDIGVSPTGDIAVVTTNERTIERVIRRLLTNPTTPYQSDRPFSPGYGVGLGERIGEALDIRAIAAAVRSQMLLERSVARIPAPVITVTEIPTGGAVININYTDLSGLPQNFGFNLTPQSAFP